MFNLGLTSVIETFFPVVSETGNHNEPATNNFILSCCIIDPYNDINRSRLVLISPNKVFCYLHNVNKGYCYYYFTLWLGKEKVSTV